MNQRLEIKDLDPEAAKAMFALEKAVSAPIEHGLYLLIKLRASYVNGCAYCIDMHAAEAQKRGEDPRRLFAVAAFRESPLFNAKERAVFELTDAVTRLGAEGVPDAIWERAKVELGGGRAIADVLMAIVAINAWNRIAISSHLVSPPLEPR